LPQGGSWQGGVAQHYGRADLAHKAARGRSPTTLGPTSMSCHALPHETLSGKSFAGAPVRAPVSTARVSALTLPCVETHGIKAVEGGFPFAPRAERACRLATLRHLVSRVASACNGLASRHERQVPFAFPVCRIALVASRKVAAGKVWPNPAVNRTLRKKPRKAGYLERWAPPV
jgi:hypothetical protein